MLLVWLLPFVIKSELILPEKIESFLSRSDFSILLKDKNLSQMEINRIFSMLDTENEDSIKQ